RPACGPEGAVRAVDRGLRSGARAHSSATAGAGSACAAWQGRSGRDFAVRRTENVMNDQKNTLLAIVLSGLVLLVWSYFFAPQLTRQEAQKPPQTQTQNQSQPSTAPTPGTQNAPASVPGQNAPPPPALTRDAALKQSGDRVPIDTPSLKGSIALKGARIDDVLLAHYRETVDPNSPPIELLSPSGSPHPFYAEFGWLPTAGVSLKVPDHDTVWRQEGSGALTPEHPVVLTY